ncbi:keratin, type I cytoskeletal 18-like [Pristis pectinata]|uniref:keratin, type I cytoskeletal 18-like n=1 Tax=Pristis pectinata TaxID=685728 RepID=UPI00223CEC5B|nr:keratin, type I cytoskeletal 18-like [Pristis pectinata]
MSHGPVSGVGVGRVGFSLPSFNQQDELQGLNQRLANYINKVKRLETANKELDSKIKVLLAKRGTLSRGLGLVREAGAGHLQQMLLDPLSGSGRCCVAPDSSAYSLRCGSEFLRHLVSGRTPPWRFPASGGCLVNSFPFNVQDISMDNAGLTLQLDNCELASDDFKVKWQSELDLRQSVEQDLNGLRKILEETTWVVGKLEAQIEAMNEELGYLRKNHQEEVDDLRKQISNSNISVELEKSEEEDLGQVINKIREEYQALADQNKKEAEECYRKKFDAASLEVSKNNEALQAAKQNVTELRRQIKNLEVEHRTLGATIQSLEDTLQDTEDRVNMEVQTLNNTISSLEQQLAKLRADLTNRGVEVPDLLNTKMRLQAEIDTYRKLLEGDGLSQSDHLRSTPGTGEPRKNAKKVIIISQKLVDGRLFLRSKNQKKFWIENLGRIWGKTFKRFGANTLGRGLSGDPVCRVGRKGQLWTGEAGAIWVKEQRVWLYPRVPNASFSPKGAELLKSDPNTILSVTELISRVPLGNTCLVWDGILCGQGF